MDIIDEGGVWRRLAFDNPWWGLKPGAPTNFKQPPRRAFFDGFAAKADNCPPGKAVVLAGARRTGKSVMMRQQIARLLESGVAPNTIIYLSLGTPSYWTSDLTGLFTLFLRHQRHKPEDRLHLFIDEAQYLRDWRKSVSDLAKANPHTRIIASVSADAPLPAFGEETRAPADSVFDVHVLPPLTFLEFLRARGVEESLFGKSDGDGRMTFKAQQVAPLNEEFQRYINFGGFPEGLLTKTEGTPPPTFVRDVLLDRLIHKDMAPLFGISDVWDMHRLFTVLAFNTANEVSIEGLTQITGIAKNTIRKYLDYLEAAFLIRRVIRLDRDAKRYRRAVAFKVYLTAPCFYAALFGPVPMNAPAFARLAETAVFAQWPATQSQSGPAYASWQGGKVGFVGLDEASGKPWLVAEMDWDESLIHSSAGPRALGEFVRLNCPGAETFALTRSAARLGVLEGVQVRILPAAFVCYMLQRRMSAQLKTPGHALAAGLAGLNMR